MDCKFFENFRLKKKFIFKWLMGRLWDLMTLKLKIDHLLTPSKKFSDFSKIRKLSFQIGLFLPKKSRFFVNYNPSIFSKFSAPSVPKMWSFRSLRDPIFVKLGSPLRAEVPFQKTLWSIKWIWTNLITNISVVSIFWKS